MKQCSYCISNLIIDKLLMVLKHFQFDQNVELAVGKQRLPVLNRSHLYSFRTNASAQNQIALCFCLPGFIKGYPFPFCFSKRRNSLVSLIVV